MDIILFQVVLLLSGGIFLLPKKALHFFTLIVVLSLITISSYWAVICLNSGAVITKTFFNDFWQNSPTLTIDALSAYFILVLNFTVLTGLIYAKGYLKQYMGSKSVNLLRLHYFSYMWIHAAMLQVTMMQDGLEFLLVWELMSLSSFILVIFDGEKKEVMKTGINYLVQMHIGFLFLLIGFFIINESEGVMSFGALASYFQSHNNFWLFLVFFIGFGIKAGFVPFHSWLPHAHPAAPSHVSGVMSGVMIKMGIYGILRILTHVQSEFLEISVFIIIISIVSGILGVVLAIYQHDLKKLLAYHSIENIGIIGIGIGFGMFGMVVNNPTLVMLGFGGGLLHVLNHSLFKSSLFYSAGSVYQATHTRDVNKLGGLIKSMPITGILFFTSALAICGIPPFNGFISEFLIYNGAFGNLSHAGYGNSLASVVVIVSLALIGGLAVFCFTKVFGVVFLGSARSEYPDTVGEVQNTMWLPGTIILLFILSIGFFPAIYVTGIVNVLKSIPYINVNPADLAILNNTLSNIGQANMIFGGIAIALILLKKWQQKRVEVLQGPTWSCGYTGGDFKHQYTSTSYANNLREVVDPLITYHRNYESFKEEEIFPEEHKFETQTEDKIEQTLLLKPINFFINWLPKAGLAQTGRINDYLLYPILFIVIIGFLTYFNVI
jgi:hydrogenase-4 component B